MDEGEGMKQSEITLSSAHHGLSVGDRISHAGSKNRFKITNIRSETITVEALPTWKRKYLKWILLIASIISILGLSIWLFVK
jgi:hypothetical protein